MIDSEAFDSYADAIKPSIEIPHTTLKLLTASDFECVIVIVAYPGELRAGPQRAITLLPDLVFLFSLRFAAARHENASSSA